ncbi:CMP/dCMP deaminase, zinc-binding domain containing protein [Rhodotorula toruloides]|uniref:CMP/dCMP deaminase, zinc-binding domain containing protein n=1 Tax=Rhodotorula toruloides TaxID=5286 RepID=A0A511KBD9_RHOTO|nr:CMP/dCMP deaminase, zinc-binding domain containing protein [Rhodotorula toruloides]
MAHNTPAHTPATLIRLFLTTTLEEIVPLTQRGVESGSKVFGAAVFEKESLEVVTVGTNHETESPLLHGEIQTIQQFYALDRSTRPEAKNCIFFSTHEPCSLCLSGITWGGFDNFYYLFTYEDTRDVFSIPYDIDILEEVFRVPCTTCSAPPTASQPLYNHANKFFTSSPLSSLLSQIPAGKERVELEQLWEKVRAEYGRISGVYQDGKGEKGIPLV